MTLSAHEFAVLSGEFGFGISKERTVAALRKLADAIESDGTILTGDGDGHVDVILKSVTVASVADADDFTITDLTLRLAERVRRGGP